MTDLAHCPCQGFAHPAVIDNQPGLSLLRYRAGDFITFRHALLLSRPGEVELAGWRPGAEGDLAVQLVEWWAVLADILTFYNERIITQAFLRTAESSAGVNALVRLLGYRPRPAIAAHGLVAALVSGNKAVTLRKGFAIQSKPGPGKQPQIFETDTDTTLLPGGAIDVDPAPDPALLGTEDSRSTILLAGVVTSIKKGDRLLLRKRNWRGGSNESAVAVVAEVRAESSPRGKKNTRVVFDAALALGAPQAADWLLLRPTQTGRLFATASAPIAGSTVPPPAEFDPSAVPAPPSPAQRLFSSAIASPFARAGVASPVTVPLPARSRFQGSFVVPDRTPLPFVQNILHLDGAASGIEHGDALLMERPSDRLPRVALVLSRTQQVWYANATLADHPELAPTTPEKVVPFPVLHTVLTVTPALTAADEVTSWNGDRPLVKVSFGWSEVGTLIGTPKATLVSTNAATSLLTLAPPPALPTPLPAMLEDASGVGAGTTITALTAGAATLGALSAPPLIAPLRLLTNLVSVSRGKSVPSEILGSGDATVAGQELVLQKSPLTYLQRGEGTASTLRIHVDGVEWLEVAGFYGQRADAHVFVTREDAAQKTHVLFGDGVNGARLPSGTNNIVASYRYGGGEEAPEAGALTIVLKPQPGLRNILNPVAVFGGADPDPVAQVRRYAPQSALTFDRTVSASDYETMAAQAPGVRRAKAHWAFDGVQQRALVTVFVGDTPDAVTTARAAIAASNDPNRHFTVALATKLELSLSLRLRVSADREPETVMAQVRAAVGDRDAGLLGTGVVRIGQVFFDSQIVAACLAVAGVQAVHALSFAVVDPAQPLFPFLSPGARHDPGSGAFFNLTKLTVTAES
ncbi:MAG: putative baseplate assembly protein [Acidobacteria bacterium]|nr:putative baseplate assembly protein [Acidobacteriota bacterium]